MEENGREWKRMEENGREWKRMEEREVRSSQGEVISESPAHVRTMGSDYRNSLACHGHGGTVTPAALRAANRQA
jgi:hypothetical protein